MVALSQLVDSGEASWTAEPPTSYGESHETYGGRMPPQDADAEQSVLGAMMLSKDAIADVVERIKGRHRWWRKSGYRVITVYSDGTRFYRRPFGRTVLHRVDVYERGGHYYINDDQWQRHRHGDDDRYGHDGRDDRDNR